MLSAKLALPLALLLALPSAARAAAPKEPGHFALLVGIDRYGRSPDVAPEDQWPRLYGPVNDTRALGALLKERGFEVKKLTNRRATREGIEKAFREDLIDKVVEGRGDVVVFAYSGHGQQVPDDEAHRDEADGYDEALIPYDNLGISTKDFSRHLRDDVLETLIGELRAKGARVVVIIDSCHSGTATRAPLRSRGAKPAYPPTTTPLPTGNGGDGAGGLFQKGADLAGDVVVLSAAQADEPALEVPDPTTQKTSGAFTWALVRTLRDIGPEDAITWDQLMAAVRAQLPAVGTPQRPVLEGRGDRVVFSGQWGSPPRFYAAPKLDDRGRLLIEAGAIHGLGAGSELEVFPPRAAAAAKLPPPLAVVTLEEVGPAESYAKLPGGFDKRELAEGAVAKLKKLVHATAAVRVALEAIEKGKERKGLADELGKLPFASVVDAKPTGDEDERPWDLLVHPSEDGADIVIEDAMGRVIPIPMGCCKEPASAISRKHPELAMRVAQAIQKDTSFRRLLGLENPVADTRLDVSLRARRIVADPTMDEPGECRPDATTPIEPGADLALGDHLYFEIENRADVPVFVSLLELTSDGRISRLELEDYAKEMQLPPKTGRILKDTCFRITRPMGPLVYTLIATDRRVDLSYLEERTRSAGGKTGLDQRLSDAKSPNTRGASDDLALRWTASSFVTRIVDGEGFKGTTDEDLACDAAEVCKSE